MGVAASGRGGWLVESKQGQWLFAAQGHGESVLGWPDPGREHEDCGNCKAAQGSIFRPQARLGGLSAPRCPQRPGAPHGCQLGPEEGGGL